MKLILLASLVLAVSCGPGKTGGGSTPVTPTPTEPTVENASIKNVFVSEAGLHGLNEIDFSEIDLNTPVDVSGNCAGADFGNVGLVNGVDRGFFEIQGTDNEGFLQYGHLNYLNPLDSLCRDLSKERYSYKITGDSLELCMVNYPFCATYTVLK